MGISVEILLLSWVSGKTGRNSVSGKLLNGYAGLNTTRCSVYAFESVDRMPLFK